MLRLALIFFLSFIDFGSCSQNDIQTILLRLDAIEKRLLDVEQENLVLREENRHIKELLRKTSINKYETESEFQQQPGSQNGSLPSENYQPAPEKNEAPELKQRNDQSRILTDSKRLLMGSTPSPTQATKVVFYAGLSKRISNLGAHQAVDFDKVLLNLGGGYSALHGHFIAPVKGIYLFSFSLHADPSTSTALQIVRNGNFIDTLYATGGSGVIASQSRTIPMALEKGDMVWVRTYPGYEGRSLYGDLNHYYSSFAGVLLYQTE